MVDLGPVEAAYERCGAATTENDRIAAIGNLRLVQAQEAQKIQDSWLRARGFDPKEARRIREKADRLASEACRKLYEGAVEP